MNSTERHRRSIAILDEVCDLAPEARESILKQKCAGDDELRRKVESMLRSDGADDPFVAAAESGRIVAEFLTDDEGASDDHDAVPERIGPYKIVRKIGEGGMGIIYEAEQESPRRRVALKVLRPGMIGRSMLKRFQHEAHVLGQLQHPGIAQIHQAGLAEMPQGRQPFFVMEYIDGAPLDRFANAQRFDTNQRLELLARVCDAVQHAHQKGIIHRDLKPSNVLVVGQTVGDATASTSTSCTDTAVDLIGQPKVLDFGIARVTDADIQTVTVQTEIGQLVGTLAYMSPEQVAGNSDDLDTRCDVYALGVMLYQLLVDRRPHDFSGMPVTEAARIIREEEPIPVGAIDKSLRGDVETIVGKAMDKDRERRYASAAEFAADIRRSLSHQPIDARPASTFYQLGKFARRNRGLVAGLVAAFLALSIGLVAAMLNAKRANEATILAQKEGERAKEESMRAKQALADVELVSDFQGAIIQSANMQEMGRLILDSLATLMEADDESGNVKASLGQVNPASLARTVVDGSLLSKASAAARDRFAERPVLQADIHDSLAMTYFAIAMYEQSLGEAQTSLALRREHLGDDHTDTIKMIGNVCHLLNNLSRPEEAEPYADEALRRLLAKLPEEDPLVLEAYYRVVFTKRGMKKLDEALDISEKLVAAAERSLEPDDWKILTYRQQLANLYMDAQRFEDALAIRESLLATYRKKLGDDHPRTLGCWSQVAMTLRHLDRLEEAETQTAEVVARAEKNLGESDPRTLRVLSNLAALRAERGHNPEARETFQTLLERQRRALPPDHPAINKTLNSITKLDDELN